MLQRLLLVIAIAASVLVTSGLTTDALAKEKDKRGYYEGGEDGGRKGSHYVSPYGHRYNKENKGSQQAPKAKPATPTPAPPAATEATPQ